MARRPPNRRVPSWITQTLPEELAESSLFRFRITLPNRENVEVDLRPDTDIDFDQLEGQLEQAPAQYIFWACLYSEMKEQQSLLERKIKARRGKLTEEATGMIAEGRLKLTKDQIALIIEKDDVLNQLEAKLMHVQKHVGKLYHMTVALQMRSEHMRSLAGFKRQEREVQR